MPYTLKPNKLFAKDPNGDGYLPQNIVTDKATEDMLAEIEEAGRTQKSNIYTAGANARSSVTSEGTKQKNAIQDKVNSLSDTINAADTKIAEINSTGTTQVNAVNAAGTTQVDAVNAAGTTQVNAVNAAGKTQTDAIGAKTDEIDQKISDASSIIDRIDAAESLISELGSLIDLVHPVGSIYISVSNEKTPDQMFGGTWEQIKDRFLLTAGDTYRVGDADGGEATHKLTENELPAFTRQIAMRKFYTENFANDYTLPVLTGSTDYGKDGEHDWKVHIGGIGTDVLGPNGLSGPVVQPAINYKNKPGVTDAATAGAARLTIDFGGDQEHNNMPPYTIVYAWKRVA